MKDLFFVPCPSAPVVDLSHLSLMCGLISLYVGFLLAFGFLLGVLPTTPWIVAGSVGSVLLGILLFAVSALIEGRTVKPEK